MLDKRPILNLSKDMVAIPSNETGRPLNKPIPL